MGPGNEASVVLFGGGGGGAVMSLSLLGIGVGDRLFYRCFSLPSVESACCCHERHVCACM